MDQINVINMIPSRTVKKHFIENNIKLTPLEELIVVRHCFKDINVKEEIYSRYSFHKDREVKEMALELICELNMFKSYINDTTGNLRFQEDGSNIIHGNFETLKKSFKEYGEKKYTKVHIEDSKKKLLSTLWLNQKGKIIFYKLWGEEEVANIFNIQFKSLPFTYKQGLKPVKQLFDNQGELYVNLSDMNETVPGVLAIVNMNDYITDIDHADDEPTIYYMSPLYLEDYGLEG